MIKENISCRYDEDTLSECNFDHSNDFLFPQISSVHEWVFEPPEIKVNFDGVNDPCSKGRDIIFAFVGFRVFGKVNVVLWNISMNSPQCSLVKIQIRYDMMCDLDREYNYRLTLWETKRDQKVLPSNSFQFYPMNKKRYHRFKQKKVVVLPYSQFCQDLISLKLRIQSN